MLGKNAAGNIHKMFVFRIFSTLSPKHKTLAKEKHGSWTISKGALEMLLL